MQGRVGELDQGEVGLDEHHERTVAALRLADERVAELQAAERDAERKVASLRARIDALAVGLERKDGTAWLTENHSGAGILGPMAKLVKVRSGYEAAVAAVLGSAADGSDRTAAAACVRAVAARPHRRARAAARGDHGHALRRRGGRRLDRALALVAEHPRLRAVTLDGDLVGAGWVSGGSDRKLSTLEVTSEIDKAGAELAAAEAQVAQLSAALSGALAEQAARQDSAEQALAALNESDSAISGMYEQLGRLGQEARTSEDEWSRLLRQREELEAGRTQTVAEVTELENRLRNAQETPQEPAAEPVNRQQIAAATDAARSAEVEARLLATRLNAVVAAASRIRDAERQQRATAMAAVRDEVNALSARVAALTDSLHRDEVANAQAALRIEQLEQMVLEQFGMAPADLIAEYGPHIALPPSELEMAEYEQAKERGEQVFAPAPIPFDRPTQERRAKRAERELAELGRVNPLALEEFAALEERYNFLSTQLEDVKAARKDLLGVVDEVDARILQVFSEAYTDVEREFSDVFGVLFPGGEGRLRLTDPSNMLTTGIEVEARPPGKKITRLSLLSGGEKALTAVAMLVAIFRARPSPFYIMDEVEAALDDTNLRRLISLFELLRARSQLIIITHQKPTMEVADALYGVTMQGDGITAVISQRMRGQQVDQLVTT